MLQETLWVFYPCAFILYETDLAPYMRHVIGAGTNRTIYPWACWLQSLNRTRRRPRPWPQLTASLSHWQHLVWRSDKTNLSPAALPVEITSGDKCVSHFCNRTGAERNYWYLKWGVHCHPQVPFQSAVIWSRSLLSCDDLSGPPRCSCQSPTRSSDCSFISVTQFTR